jgi:hypothetical protein
MFEDIFINIKISKLKKIIFTINLMNLISIQIHMIDISYFDPHSLIFFI